MKVTLLLCDSAQAVSGKLYILGGGWSITGPAPTASAIAMKVEVPWDQSNKNHRWTLELLNGDGQPVDAPTPGGILPVRLEGNFEVGRPPGLQPGTPLDVALAINVAPLPLTPGRRYVWRLTIDDHGDENWQVAFTTRPGPVPEQQT